MPKGKLIVIEGSDGSGKKTQTQLLVQKLREAGQRVETLDFPQYETFWGKVIKAYLSGQFGNLNEIDPKDSFVPYTLNRVQAEPQIQTWLGEGAHVVLDRWSESNYAHQCAKIKDYRKKMQMLAWAYDFETKKFGLPESDLVIFLYLPVEPAQRAMDQEGRKKDIHESNTEYLIEVERTYKLFAQKFGWVVIPCLNDSNERIPLEQITEQIWAHVSSLLSSSP